MDYQKTIKNLNDAIMGLRDSEFIPVLESVHCMSRPRVYAVLNAIVSSMEPDELYVEVGTYQGGSLVSALLGNNAHAIGVDSFEEFQETNSFERTRSNLDHFGVGERVELRNSSFQSFFKSLPKETRIHIYYYDGAHGYEVQLAGMEAAWDFMPLGALIVVDDFTYPEVHLAVNRYIANHINSVKPLFIFDPIESTDPVWWNGCVVLRKVK